MGRKRRAFNTVFIPRTQKKILPFGWLLCEPNWQRCPSSNSSVKKIWGFHDLKMRTGE
jgi:hypothetical protein